MITNPPYGAQVKYRWLRKAYARRKPFALLLPLETWGTKQAQVVFVKHGVEVILFNERIDYVMPEAGYVKGGSNFASAWFTWGLKIGLAVSYADITDARRAYEYVEARRAYEQQQPALFVVN